MKKMLMFAIPILLLLFLSTAKADIVYTTTGAIWTNITFDNRTLVDWDFYLPNSTNCPGCVADIVLSNLERQEVFAVFQIIPMPNDNCFNNYQNCSMSGYSAVANFSYSRPAYIDSFWGGTKYTSNWGGALIDTSNCWNWWAYNTEDKRESQQKNCPVVAVKLDKSSESLNFYYMGAATPGAEPDYIVRFLGYSANYVDVDQKISKPIYNFINSLVDFQGIILDIWGIAYYTFAVLLIIYDLVMVIGILPLGLRWVIKKVTGEK